MVEIVNGDKFIKNVLEQPAPDKLAATPTEQAQRNVRDYFAGQIIGGRMSIPDRSLKDAEFFVGDVFDLADRMLRESIKRGGW